MTDDPAIGRVRLFFLALSLALLSIDTQYSSSPEFVEINLTPSLFGALLAAACLFAPRILNRALHTSFWIACGLIAIEFAFLTVQGIAGAQATYTSVFTYIVEHLSVAATLALGVSLYIGMAAAAPRRLKPRTHTLALLLALAIGVTYGATQLATFISRDAFVLAGWSYLAALLLAFAFAFMAETPLDG